MLRAGFGAPGSMLVLEGPFEVLAAVEDAMNNHHILLDDESDGDAPPESDNSQPGPEVTPASAAPGEGGQAVALSDNGIHIACCNFW